MTRFLLALILPVVLASGCVSPAHRLDPGIVNAIREGATTRGEVQKTLGKPWEELHGSNRKRLATYRYSRQKPDAAVPTPSIMPNKAGTVLLRTLTLIYDEHDTVEKLLFYETTAPVFRQLSTFWIGQELTERETSRIVKGKSGEADLEAAFGPPTARSLTIEGTPIMAWSYLQTKSRFGLRQSRQTLYVYFDRSGVAYDYVLRGDVGLNEKKP